MPNWSRTFQSFWSNSYCLALEKQPEKLNFHDFFTSKRLCGGYLQWNAWTYFWKLCNWTRYSNGKLIKKKNSNFLVALPCFCFSKATLKALFSEFFTSKRPFHGYFQWNACTYFQKIKYRNAKLIKNISISLQVTPCVCNIKFNNFYMFWSKKTIFFHNEFFLWTIFMNMKYLNVHFNKKNSFHTV